MGTESKTSPQLKEMRGGFITTCTVGKGIPIRTSDGRSPQTRPLGEGALREGLSSPRSEWELALLSSIEVEVWHIESNVPVGVISLYRGKVSLDMPNSLCRFGRGGQTDARASHPPEPPTRLSTRSSRRSRSSGP
jgi:hypothetical protein